MYLTYFCHIPLQNARSRAIKWRARRPGCWQAGRLLLQHQLDIDIPFERQRIMSESQTLVVKLGTSVLTGGSRRLNRAHIVELVRQCAQLHAMGHRIVIVTSGAIAAGREHLGYPELPATIASKQLLAAVGQSRLDPAVGTAVFYLWHSRWPDAADPRRHGRQRTVPQRPRHPARAAG
jgi:glutamate 5-kinase